MLYSLSPNLEKNTRDSNLQISPPTLGLRLLKIIFLILKQPFNILGYYESVLRKNSRFGAGGVYMKLMKKIDIK